MDIAFTVHLPVDTDSVPFIRGLCRQALGASGSDGRHRVTLEKRPTPDRPLRLVDPV